MLCYELMPNHCLHHIFPTVDCSRFDIVRPVFEKTLAEFGVQQKLIVNRPTHDSMRWSLQALRDRRHSSRDAPDGLLVFSGAAAHLLRDVASVE